MRVKRPSMLSALLLRGWVRAPNRCAMALVLSLTSGIVGTLHLTPGHASTASSTLQRLKLDNDLRLSESARAALADAAEIKAPPLPSEAPTLAGLVALAQQHDPSYRAAQAGLEGTREYETIGRASMLPAMQASGSRSRNRQDREVQQGDQRIEDQRFYNAASATVQLRQPIYAPETRARYDEALALIDEAEVTFTDEFSQMVIRVVDAYLNLVFATKRAEVLRGSADDLNDLLRSAERRLEYGDATRVEVLDLTARQRRAGVQARAAENQRRTAASRLASLVGGIDQRVFDEVADAGGRLHLSRGSIEGWKRVAQLSSTRRLAGEAKIAQAEAALLSAKGANLPRVDALASFSINDSDTVNTVDQRFETGSLGIQVSVPIFAAGSGRAGVRQAEAFLLQAREELVAVELELEQSVREAYDGFLSAVDEERAMVSVDRAARASADAAAKGYEAGVQSLLDVVVAKGLARDVALESLEIRYETARAFVVLHELAGQVDDELIQTLSTAFAQPQTR